MAGSKISVVDSDTEAIPRYTDAFEIFRRTCRRGGSCRRWKLLQVPIAVSFGIAWR